MEKKYAFTLLEVLISLVISSFIMVAMFRVYMNAVSYVNISREQMIFNRKVYLVFDQLERDLSAAFIPKLHEEKPEQKGEVKKDDEKKEEPKKPEEKKKQKKDLNFFLSSIYEGETQKIKDKKWELFKSINFITTNPLQVYGQKRIRLVRVMYELVKDKTKSTKEKTSYILYRKETEDLENQKLQEPEELGAKEKYSVRKHLLLNNIKGLYLACVEIKDKKEKEQKTFFGTTKSDRELVTSFVWGQADESKKAKEDKVPTFILLKLILWNDDLSSQCSFDNIIQIFSYTTSLEEEKKVEEKKEEPKTEENKEVQPGQGGPAPKVEQDANKPMVQAGVINHLQVPPEGLKIVAKAQQPVSLKEIFSPKEVATNAHRQIIITPEMFAEIQSKLEGGKKG